MVVTQIGRKPTGRGRKERVHEETKSFSRFQEKREAQEEMIKHLTVFLLWVIKNLNRYKDRRLALALHEMSHLYATHPGEYCEIRMKGDGVDKD